MQGVEPQLIGECLLVSGYCTTFGSGDIFNCVERKDRWVFSASYLVSMVFGTDCMCCIFYDDKGVFLRNISYGIKICGMSSIMNGYNRFCPACDFFPDLFRRNEEAFILYICEYWVSSCMKE